MGAPGTLGFSKTLEGAHEGRGQGKKQQKKHLKEERGRGRERERPYLWKLCSLGALASPVLPLHPPYPYSELPLVASLKGEILHPRFEPLCPFSPYFRFTTE
jgi:hypothetical protein